MLHHYCGQFLEYYQLADFSARSILALNSRLNELMPIQKRSFRPISALCSKLYPRDISYMPVVKFFVCLDLKQKFSFLDGHELTIFKKPRRIRSVKRVRYRHLINFTADYNDPSIHVTKSRVWALRIFYHFLTLHRIVPKNIATGIHCMFLILTINRQTLSARMSPITLTPVKSGYLLIYGRKSPHNNPTVPTLEIFIQLFHIIDNFALNGFKCIYRTNSNRYASSWHRIDL